MKPLTKWKCQVRSRFWIRSAELTPDAIAQALGIEADSSGRKGEASYNGSPSPFHRFVLMNPTMTAEGAACLGCMEAEIESMLERLEPILPRLVVLHEQVELEMRVFYHSDGGFLPIHFSPELMARFSSLRCALMCHVGYDQWREEV